MLRPFLLLVLLAGCGEPVPPTPVLADPVTAEPIVPAAAPEAAPAGEVAPAAAPTDAPAAVATPAKPGEPHPALLNPALARETAPNQFKVQFETTKGKFVVEVHRDWAPKGVDRFYNLVKIGFYDDAAFFRAVKGFVEIGRAHV